MSLELDDGGAAFPRPASDSNYSQQGMSLRDWFAGQERIEANEEFGLELCEALAGPRPKEAYKDNPLEWFNWSNKWQAAVRYARADAMLAARLTQPK